MSKNNKHRIITTITRKRFMEINQWVLAGRLPGELLQYQDSLPGDIPKKALTKMKQADIIMRFHQEDETVIRRLLENKKWRIITVRVVGEDQLAEMILT